MDLQKESEKLIAESIDSGEEHGVQFCVYRHGECVVDVAAGYADFTNTRPTVRDTLFPLYSSGKALPAAVMCQLIEQGLVHEDTPIREIWPEFAVNGKENTLLIHILDHTSGLPQRFAQQDSYEAVADWPRMVHAIEQCAPDWVPGSQVRYQSLTYGWVMTELIERLTGMPFMDYLQKHILGPAHICDMAFGLSDNEELRTAEFRHQQGFKWSKSISICDPLDELMRQPCIRRMVQPGFNGFSSAESLAKFYDAILRGCYFSEKMLERAIVVTSPQPGNPDPYSWNSYSHGFCLSGPLDDVSRSFGHSGYGGMVGCADRKSGYAVGLTVNLLGNHPLRVRLFELLGLDYQKDWDKAHNLKIVPGGNVVHPGY